MTQKTTQKSKWGWLTESNRWKHLVAGIPVAFLFSINGALGVASGMEFKDCHYANGDKKPITQWSWKAWDWLDWWLTMAGGIIGEAARIGVALWIFG